MGVPQQIGQAKAVCSHCGASIVIELTIDSRTITEIVLRDIKYRQQGGEHPLGVGEKQLWMDTY